MTRRLSFNHWLLGHTWLDYRKKAPGWPPKNNNSIKTKIETQIQEKVTFNTRRMSRSQNSAWFDACPDCRFPRSTIPNYLELILPRYIDDINNLKLFPSQKMFCFRWYVAFSLKSGNFLKVFWDHQERWVWSGHSHDFNVIEHLWTILLNLICFLPRSTSRKKLFDKIILTWNLTDLELLGKLDQSLSKRKILALKSSGVNSWHSYDSVYIKKI